MIGGATSLDGRLAVWVATHRYGPLNDVAVWLGRIDQLGAVWVVIALAVSLALWHRAVPAAGVALATAATTLCADGIATGVKDLVHRPRPSLVHPQIHPLVTVHSTSFPSGHAATAFAGAVVASYVAPRLAVPFALFAVAIALSRVYVGVHYATDVTAGAAIGAAVGFLSVSALRLAIRRRGIRWPTAHRGRMMMRSG